MGVDGCSVEEIPLGLSRFHGENSANGFAAAQMAATGRKLPLRRKGRLLQFLA
jgi:hypothetical protein